MFTAFKRNIDDKKEGIHSETNVQFFDNECKKLKRNYYPSSNYYRSNPCNESKSNIVQARSKYKNTVRKNEFIFDENETKKLEAARFSNA